MEKVLYSLNESQETHVQNLRFVRALLSLDRPLFTGRRDELHACWGREGDLPAIRRYDSFDATAPDRGRIAEKPACPSWLDRGNPRAMKCQP